MKKKVRIAAVVLLAAWFSAGSVSAQNADQKLSPVNPSPKQEERIRQYWFVMLVKGNNRSQDSATAAKLQEGHMANIGRLYKLGKIKVAGPFGDDGAWRGIFIFDCETKEEVIGLLDTDPAISSGRLAFEIHPWWTAPIGSFKPGLPE
jgi:uncharacterized protein YciI